MWKVLSGIAALLLFVSAIFSYLNNNLAREEKLLLQRAQQYNADARSHLSDADSELANSEASLEQFKLNLEADEKALADAEAGLTEAEAKLATTESLLAETAATLQDYQTKMQEIGNLKEVEDTLAQLETQIAEQDERIASLKNVQAVTLDQKAQTEVAISKFQRLVANQKSGKMPAITARVRNVYNEWGFIVINAGNRLGVVRQAKLDIRRGGETIAQAVVSQVEQGVAVANIVKSSLAEGQTVQPGDTVTVAQESKSNPQA